jgi:hypothetical protein
MELIEIELLSLLMTVMAGGLIAVAGIIADNVKTVCSGMALSMLAGVLLLIVFVV